MLFKKESGIILSAFLIDQVTKHFGHSIYYHKVTHFFNIAFSKNYGTSFDFVQCYPCWTHKIIFFMILMIFVFAVSLLTHAKETHEKVAYAMIVGGAAGNIVDRLLHGYVIDFLQFHYKGWYYPVFNFADAFIVVGIGILLIASLKSEYLLKKS